MRPILKHLTALCAGSLLFACAGPVSRAPSKASLAADAEQAYLIGRSYHMALRPAQALTYYSSALRDDPAHLNARNGLAVLYAEQGQVAQAIVLWQELTATAPGSRQSFLFTNLGYAHLTQGEPARALAVLEQACLLDPLNERAWQHLGDALARTGQQERAAAMHKQAASLRGHDLRLDVAAAAGTGVAAIGKAVAAAVPGEHQWAHTEISQSAGGMYVLRRIEPAYQGQPQPQALLAPAERGTARPLLEIRNGNGVTGMARSMARSMGEDDPRVVRLTNQKGYGVKQTRVEYQPAFKNAAERLAERVGAHQVVPAGAADRGRRADLRLVLGRDLAKPAAATVATLQKAKLQPG